MSTERKLLGALASSNFVLRMLNEQGIPTPSEARRINAIARQYDLRRIITQRKRAAN